MYASLHTLRIDRMPLMLIGLAVMLAVLLLIPEHAFASVGAGGDMPYEDGLGKIRASVTGPVAYTLSIVGIVVAGITLIFGGDMSGFFRTLVFLVLLISLLIGAQNFMSTTMGRGAELASANAVHAQAAQARAA